MKTVTLSNYKADPYYSKIVRAVEKILAKGAVVAPVDVLIHIDLLSKESLEDWRFGRVPYLEKVVRCNLSKASRVLRILRFHAHDLNMSPSITAYMKWGKGPRRPLRFSKTGAQSLEEAYSRHFISPGLKKNVDDKHTLAKQEASQEIAAADAPLRQAAVIYENSFRSRG